MPRSPVRYAPRVESRPVPDVPAARPFLKWAGGKTQLLSELDSAVPDFGGQYFEPFLGGGALFFRLASTRPGLSAHLNDINHDLVTAYESVRDHCEAVVTALEILEETYLEGDSDARERTYYEVRGKRPSDGVAVAARLIFLNKTCFNGLYRVNRAGDFNVPHGRYAKPGICDVPRLRAASRALRRATLTADDFVEACAAAGRGDLVYFDPPYHPLSATSSFTAYTDRDFGDADQIRLRDCVDRLTERGARVIISNSSHPWIEELYQSPAFQIRRIEASRAINARGDRRGPVGELLITNEPGVCGNAP